MKKALQSKNCEAFLWNYATFSMFEYLLNNQKINT